MPVGTMATICVSLQVDISKVWPRSCTELLPCELPKLLPVMVTGTPAPAVPGVMLVSVGTALVTEKLTEALAPPAVTSCRLAVPAGVSAGMATHTCVSLHREGVKPVPFKVIVPAVLPNPAPFAHWFPLAATGSHCADVMFGTD